MPERAVLGRRSEDRFAEHHIAGDRFDTGRAGSDQQRAIRAIIEAELIPRLLSAHETNPAGSTVAAVDRFDWIATHIGEFSDLVVQTDAAAATAFFGVLRNRGASIEILFQKLLKPTALRLGELWDADILSFLEVKLGLSRLEQLARTFGLELRRNANLISARGTALMVPVPGEEHVLGLSILETIFHREGWQVQGGRVEKSADIVQMVSARSFDVVGLSASRLDLIDPAASVIKRIRRKSRNSSIIVLVGGRVFDQSPSLVSEVGADATGSDGHDALRQLPKLLEHS